MKTTILSLALVCLSAAEGAAQQTDITIDRCVQLALERNLTLQSGRIAVEKAEALQATAFNLDPTELSLDQDPTSGGSPDNAISLSQTFSLPTVYAARRRMLKAQTGAERSRLQLTRAQLTRDVRRAYCAMDFARQMLAAYIDRDSVLVRFSRMADARHSAGEGGNLERMNANRLHRENDLAVERAHRNYTAACRRLLLWMNTDSIQMSESAAPLRLSMGSASAFSAAATPEADVLDRDIETSRRTLAAVRQEALPTIKVGASAQLVIKGFNPYHVDRSAYDKGDFMGFSVGVNVPLAFGAQRAKVRAAKKDVEMATLARESELKQIENDWRQALGEYEKARTSVEYYEKEALHEAAEMARISQTSYENGEISYVELMQNLESANQVRMDYLSAINEFNLAVVEINYLKGE